jgi:hypothetical protein
MTHSEKLEKIVADAVEDIGEVFSEGTMLNRRSEIERIIRRVASDTIGVSKEIVGETYAEVFKRS